MTMDKMKDVALLVGRVLLALMFVMAGWGKIGGYAGTQGYMEAMGVPGFMLPLVILLELGGGLPSCWACLPAASPCCWPVSP
jgi:putative oxidoreductase